MKTLFAVLSFFLAAGLFPGCDIITLTEPRQYPEDVISGKSQPVTDFDLSMLPAPVTNREPLAGFATAEYTAGVTWKQNGVIFTGYFEVLKEYSASVTLTAKEGYIFQGDEPFAHNMAVAVSSEYKNSNTSVVTVHFPATLQPPASSDLSLIPTPAAGEGAVTEIKTKEYSFSISWKENDFPFSGVFRGGKYYSAAVSITPNESYGFENFSETFTHPDAAVVSQEITGGIATVFLSFPYTLLAAGHTDLSSIIAAPVSGSMPQTAFDAAEYSGEIEWSRGGASFSGAFASGAEYAAAVTLTPKTGYTFRNFKGNFTHGAAVKASQEYKGPNTFAVVLHFPATLQPAPRADLSPIPAPVAGEGAVTEIRANEFSFSVSWKENDLPFSGVFRGGKYYSAVAGITPDAGYGFENFQFTHPEAVVISQEVTGRAATALLSFPYTLLTVGHTDLSSIAAPVSGNMPQTAFDAAEYSGEIEWSRDGAAFSGAFSGGKTYSAAVTLTPKTGYTFRNFTGVFTHPKAAAAGQGVADNRASVTLNFRTPASDADFISLTGERYEKYYAVVDPAIRNRNVVGASYRFEYSALAGNGLDFYTYEQTDYYNSYTLAPAAPISLRDFYSGAAVSFYALGGNLTYRNNNPTYAYKPLVNGSSRLGSYNLDTSLNFNALSERKDAPASFSSGSLVLQKTSSYSNPYYEYLYKTIFLEFAPSFVQSFELNNPGTPPNFPGGTLPYFTLAANTRHSFTIFEPFIYESRNFYQYRSFTLKYGPDAEIVSVTPNPIVQSYSLDHSANTLTVILKDYDEPYYGNIITFRIQAEDLTLVEKAVEILP
jgi:hypothetical protein